MSCGIGSWRPECLQKLATPKMFFINFCLVAIFQGASFTYLIGSMSTLEKRYGFESKVSGFILIADNLSQMIINPFIGYLGSKYNRPLIMAIGEIIVALSCFMCVIPYFIYGAADYNLQLNSINNYTQTYEACDASRVQECSQSATIWPAVAILWFASFINGVGYTAFYTVGIPYMDDNTSKKSLPLYLSYSAALRLCGPALGLLLSSFCLSFYENPFYSPNIAQNDPRWIGCWWIGYCLIGVCLVLFSLPLSLFPTSLKQLDASQAEHIENSTKWALEALKRLLKNPIFMFNLFGMTLRLLGYLGYYIFKPKYIEAQFRKSASIANFWTGLTSIPTMAIGIMAGGFVLSKFKPSTRTVVIYMFVVELFTNFAILGVYFLRCPKPIFPQTFIQNKILNLDSKCNVQCKCSTNFFQPVCTDDGISNYFSPCYAGCQSLDRNSPIRKFSDCSCIGSGAVVTNGYCETDCNQFPYYIAVLGFAGIIMSTTKIGDTLLTLRCVEPRDKSFAMGIIGSFLAIFAFIPYPLIFGSITDMSCIVWKESCGKTGNCWLYDIEKLAYYLHISAFALLMVGTFFDIPIIYYAKRIKNMFEDEDIKQPSNEHEMGKTNTAFNGSNDEHLDVDKHDRHRKESLNDYELVHRKNSFIAL